METFSHFTYNPLDTLQSEIRLISLQPSQHDNDIECQLLSANLDEQPVFEALSYEWGPPTPLSHCSWIKLDGHNSPVRENLRAALSCLRFKDKARIIWIDALCINQKDVKERNHQVAQMGKIYSQASRVIAWLG
ncbi:HET-domain-containing protein, partial [Mollisia scopiformis]